MRRRERLRILVDSRKQYNRREADCENVTSGDFGPIIRQHGRQATSTELQESAAMTDQRQVLSTVLNRLRLGPRIKQAQREIYWGAD